MGIKNKVNVYDEDALMTDLESVSTFPRGTSITHRKIEEEPTYNLAIIIPAYNVEDYIDDCLVSVLNQKTKY